MPDSELDRLLRAARFNETTSAETPFGFETRVVASWRAGESQNGVEAWGLLRLFRRVAVAAMMVALCAGAGAFWQFQENDALDAETAGLYAMADSVIEAGTWP